MLVLPIVKECKKLARNVVDLIHHIGAKDFGDGMVVRIGRVLDLNYAFSKTNLLDEER